MHINILKVLELKKQTPQIHYLILLPGEIQHADKNDV